MTSSISVPASVPSGPRIGLALGGGSARGLGHIPMLEVFDELGLKPAVIAGCSIGSLMGAGYAAGLTARDMREHTEALLASRVDTLRHIFRDRKTRLGDLLTLRGLGTLLIQGETLVEVALPHGLPQRIEDMAIPFKVVTTDYDSQEERVLTSGSLVKALAASIAIPGLIAAPKIDGRVHVDGGVTNPVPFDHVRDTCDFVVAIDVTGRPRPPAKQHHSNRELALGSVLIMFHQIAELRRALNPPDIYIEPPLDHFTAADFFKVKEMWASCGPAKEKLKRALDLRINGTA
jgi:NTE family protein